MRQLFAILICIVLSLGSTYAKIKIEDRSERKRPAWVGGYEHNYIIKSARGETMDQAKSLVEAAVKDEIARSVGEYVTATDLTQIGQISGKIHNNYSSQISTQISGIIRLTEVNMANVKGFYWERCRNRKTKQTYYEYHIKYPFGSAIRAKIIGYYKDMEAEINAQIAQYEDVLNTFTSYEELEENIASLKVYYDYYKDNRRVKIRQIMARYLSTFQALAIVPTSAQSNGFSFEVRYKGRAISIASMPIVYVGAGDGVKKIACQNSGAGWIIDAQRGQNYQIRFVLTYVKLNYKHLQQ